MPVTSTDGLLLVDKPAGRTSHDIVAAVRRALGASRAGHTGTLDPFATGLLVVLVGAATRLARFVPADPKLYEAVIRFGVETDTDDLSGTPGRKAPLPDEPRVREALPRLTGTLRQVPPDYSAKQVGGRRAYALARRGEAMVQQPVTVHVHGWEVLGHEGDRWRVRISCGSGTYVRALARDLGRLTGSAAHLVELRRLRVGPFDVHDALSPDAVAPGAGLVAMADAVPALPRQVLDAASAAHVRHGRAVAATIEGPRAALVDEEGVLLAVAERANDQWSPRVVLVAS
jgi:tRNA pseudouridine55 synthase